MCRRTARNGGLTDLSYIELTFCTALHFILFFSLLFYLTKTHDLMVRVNNQVFTHSGELQFLEFRSASEVCLSKDSVSKFRPEPSFP